MYSLKDGHAGSLFSEFPVYRIASIEIVGFRGSEKPLHLPMDGGVNFFIGRNGTGKTRLMNLLNFALSADVSNLVEIEFRSITFKLARPNERGRPYIRISKELDSDGEPVLVYKVAPSARAKPVDYRFDSGNLRSPWFRRTIRTVRDTRHYFPDDLNELAGSIKSAISQYISLSWLSVHRAVMESQRDGERKFESPVDRKLDSVARDFGVYFSTLDKMAAEETDKFQQVYLLSLISPSGIEALANLEAVNADDEKAEIRGMFAEFNIKSSVYSSKLDNFTRRMARALANYKPGGPIQANDFLVLTDTIRIHDAVKEWHRLLEKRSAIYRPKDIFVSTLNDMFYKKRVSINSGNQPVFVSDSGDEIDINNLSSGEKQLFILLGETLLQRQKECIFMADEPELSLHIDWQERLVPSLRKINPNAQIIFATHSPDVVGAFRKNAIDLEKVY